MSAFKKVVLSACSKSYSVNSITCLDETICLDIYTEMKPRKEEDENADEDIYDELSVFSSCEPLSEFQSSAVEYIAGYIEKRFKSDCKSCSEFNVEPSMFITFRSKGGLIQPAQSSVLICRISEQIILEDIRLERLLTRSKDYLGNKVMTSLVTQHPEVFKGCSTCNKYCLVKSKVMCYINLRMRHFARCENRKIKSSRKRPKLTKLVHFYHQ